jgi:iron complex outermembrane receptor protein
MNTQSGLPARMAAGGRSIIAISMPFFVLPVVVPAHAQRPDVEQRERVVVVGERVYPVVDAVTPDIGTVVDTAELLRQLPGANLNANGALTGIAQYRGLYGDRVAISIDGLGTVTGGPNAMDAPLSYASPLLLSHLSLERGIASVSSATESLGGHLSADYDRGQYADGRDFSLAGKLQTQFADNGGLSSTAFQLVGADTRHKITLLGQHDQADDFDYPDGRLTPTRLERDRTDLSYAFKGDETDLLIFVGQLDTTDTGTPSLPMDIREIDTDIYGLRVEQDLGEALALEAAISYSEVFHIMDNHGLRTLPATPMDYRSTTATGDGYQWRLAGTLDGGETSWKFGLDGQTADHTAVITNPNVPPFRIDNFNGAERDVVGAFGQWNRQQGALDIEAGLRLNSISTNSDPVSAFIPAMNPMMQMMAMNAALLAEAFNASDLDRTQTNVDAVFKLGRTFGGMRNIYVEVARKTRAPSYQELFLWLPLPSTGGLADGRSYIGNPSLRSEVSREINLGSNWQGGKAWLAPQVFYKDISDYIQGAPSTNSVANMVAMMMSGMPALEFTNTDAKIYGIDLAWGYYLTQKLTLDGALTHTRGERTDVDDNLYRLAPMNGRVALSYEADGWLARIEAVAYAAQDKVASYNAEPRTAGYGILNLSVQWDARTNLRVTAMASNLLDRRYQDHLDGVNRVSGVDVALGERLYGIGRSVQAGVRFSW